MIGGWRDHYRHQLANGKEVILDGREMPYLEGPKIDPADVLPDGRAFQTSTNSNNCCWPTKTRSPAR